MGRALTFLSCLVIAAGCGSSTATSNGGDGGSPGGSAGAAGVGGSGTGGTTATGGAAGSGGNVGGHVAISNGGLLVDGKPTFLFGGDVHYFRVRASDFDAQKTEAMWVQTLDLMKAAGMNLVTTYAAWDYHELAPGQWDFTGARDVGRFVQLACDRGMYVVYKPGPLITAEWPRGFGTFGAVPAWWKQAHPEALARNGKGELYSYSPTGAVDQRQPSYLHPTYLDAVKQWYSKALAAVKPYIGTCLIALQVDNETNLYWSNRFGDADYSDVAKQHYRDWLAQKYGGIAQLNARYGKSYAGFSDVEPPTSAPGWTTAKSDNPWYADWYWAGQTYSRDYLAELRKLMEADGFHDPDVLFFTNDSPFGLLGLDFTLRNVLLHDGPTKNQAGVCGLDLYPKQDPTSKALQDQPFQADFFTRLYDESADLATGPQGYVYAAELQGGFYELPAVGSPVVRPEATEQILMRTVGRGLKGGAFYVMRDGLNADGSAYDYQAAIAADGTPTSRYLVMQRWGQFLAQYGEDLLQAEEVENRVAVVTNGGYAVPQGGILDDLQRLTTIEQPAVFGWLAAAGFNPRVLDVRLASAAELAANKVVFYLNPDFQDDATAQKLSAYANGGGTLVTFLWPGRQSDDFVSSAASLAFAALYPAQDKGYWQWLNASREGMLNADFPGFKGQLESYWYESQWAPNGGNTTAILWERTEPLGTNGDVVGWTVEEGANKRAFIGTYVASRFNQNDYYSLPKPELERAAALARHLVSLGGESRILEVGDVRQLAWARRSPKRTYLFVINDNDQNATVAVKLADSGALGISAGTSYVATEALRNVALGTHTGAALATSGLSVPVPASSGAIVLLDPS